MPQGNWTCSECGTTITELPFEPRSTENLKCKECHQKSRAGSNTGGGERKMYSGDWVCSGCGGKITELPFEPRSTENLKCKDCFRASRA